MRTIGQEAAPQIAPRDCSKGAVRGRSIYEILVKGEFSIPSSTHFTKGFLLVTRI